MKNYLSPMICHNEIIFLFNTVLQSSVLIHMVGEVCLASGTVRRVAPVLLQTALLIRLSLVASVVIF